MSIKANELRVGIWIKENGEDVQVEIKDLEFYAFIPGLLDPIPITEEWLLRFGFETSVTNFSLIPPDTKDMITYYSLTYGRKTVRFGYQYGDYVIYYEHELCGFTEIADEYTVRYVHQLQNLFFALTGQELTVKELA